MAEFKGQTDQITKIKVASVFLSAKWGLPTVSLGGVIPLEVQTLYVSDGSKVKISVKDGQGKEVDSVSGVMYGNFFKMPYTVKADASNTLYFEAELPDHQLKGRSGIVRVSLVKVTDAKWFDDKGKETAEATEDQILVLKAKCAGAPDDTPCDVVIRLKLREEAEKTVYEGQAKVQEGAIELTWMGGLKESVHKIKDHTTLGKVGEDYYPPELKFKVSCLGVVGESPALTVTHLLTLRYEAAPGKAGSFEGKKIGVIAPDGVRTDHAIPADGLIEVKQSKPGVYRIDESALKNPFTNPGSSSDA
ncbi:MAG: hypothetical protein JWO30_4236 [Fibrobacteres bacterium]|nr:hypothetical protein [Fibrobacterota bacterium]